MNDLRKSKFETKVAAAEAAVAAGAKLYVGGRRTVATAEEEGETRVYNLGGGEGAYQWRWLTALDDPSGIR
jgi:hypothetical protein